METISMKVVAVIPARYGSTRFEGKILAEILGKPMIQWVYEGVSQSRLIEKIVVATDDRRIFEAVKSFDGNVMMTSPEHPTGTDRIAEVVRKLRAEIIVNIQGDEPLIKGSIIDKAIRPMLVDDTLLVSTLMTRIEEVKDWLNPHIVKVVTDQKGFALYFSRSPIPFPRDIQIDRLESHPFGTKRAFPKKIFKHIGIYVFRRNFLLRYSKMKPTPLEKLENLEQLRVLENSYPIKVSLVDYEPIGVDTPEDIQKVLKVLSASH